MPNQNYLQLLRKFKQGEKSHLQKAKSIDSTVNKGEILFRVSENHQNKSEKIQDQN